MNEGCDERIEQHTEHRAASVMPGAPDQEAGAMPVAPAVAVRTAPFVSVVVPTYNRAAFLSQCLGSLFAQTYPHDRFEILLVDDGSTDGTAQVARAIEREFATTDHGRLRVVQKENGGPASARNAGIRAAAGEIVAFTDSDCVADPDWLERLVAALAAEPETAGVGGPLTNVLPSGWVARFLDSTDFYRHRVRHGEVDYLLTGNVAFRRAALLAMDGFAEREGAWGEDADLSFRLRQAGYRLLVSANGGVTHHGSPATTRGLARELYRYGYGNSVLSRNWTNGRTPLVEFVRHSGAMVLAPVLALRATRRVGLLRALSFSPLHALEHGAFVAGLLRGQTHLMARGRARAQLANVPLATDQSIAEPLATGQATLPLAAHVSAQVALSAPRFSDVPLVSVVMPVRNESRFIARSLGAVLAQDYPVDRIEVLLVDGQSDDDTLRIALSLPGAEHVRVLRNPARLQAAGLNLALRAARGEIVVRVDGHTVLAPDYVRQCVATLRATGAANVGGRMDASTDAAEVTPAALAVALATGSRFGVPTAFHTSSRAQETDTVYLGAWPRAVLEALGGFDERMPPNEDYELNYRIRRAGGHIYLNPAIRSVYFPRQSLSALARQYLGYGQGKARMLMKHPASVRPRQLVAPAFVAAGVLGILLARIPLVRALWLAMLAVYAALNAMVSLRLIRGSQTLTARGVRIRLPLVFATIHLAWGAGFWSGLLPLLVERSWRRVGRLGANHGANHCAGEHPTASAAPTSESKMAPMSNEGKG